MSAFKIPGFEMSHPMFHAGYVRRCFRNGSPAGFTLLEVIICLSIISIVLVAVYRMHSQTLLMNQSTQFYTTAPLLAQRQLTAIELNTLSDLTDDSGDFGDEYAGYDWKISVNDVGATEPDTVFEDLKKIDITVRFNRGELVYNLRTYRYIQE